VLMKNLSLFQRFVGDKMALIHAGAGVENHHDRRHTFFFSEVSVML
jgi:hypothetical protein